MTPALSPVSPQVMKALLEKDGFRVSRETEFHWTLFKENASMPVIVVPKKGDLLALDVMMGILDMIKMSNGRYAELLRETKN